MIVSGYGRQAGLQLGTKPGKNHLAMMGIAKPPSSKAFAALNDFYGVNSMPPLADLLRASERGFDTPRVYRTPVLCMTRLTLGAETGEKLEAIQMEARREAKRGAAALNGDVEVELMNLHLSQEFVGNRPGEPLLPCALAGLSGTAGHSPCGLSPRRTGNQCPLQLVGSIVLLCLATART